MKGKPVVLIKIRKNGRKKKMLFYSKTYKLINNGNTLVWSTCANTIITPIDNKIRKVC